MNSFAMSCAAVSPGDPSSFPTSSSRRRSRLRLCAARRSQHHSTLLLDSLPPSFFEEFGSSVVALGRDRVVLHLDSCIPANDVPLVLPSVSSHVVGADLEVPVGRNSRESVLPPVSSHMVGDNLVVPVGRDFRESVDLVHSLVLIQLILFQTLWM
jgi:hypothetical protein